MYLHMNDLSVSVFAFSFYDAHKLLKYSYEIALYVYNKVIFDGSCLKVASLQLSIKILPSASCF